SLNKKRGDTARSRCRIRLCKYDIDAGNVAVRNPDLCAIQNVMVAVAHCPSLNPSRIRARLRLGQAERSDNLAARESRKIFLLLRFGAVLEHRASGYSIRHTYDHSRGSIPPRYFLNHHCVADRIRAGSSPFLWNHHPAAAKFAELAELRNGIFVLAFVFANHRAHFRFHELAHGVANEKLIACERKIHSEGVRAMLAQRREKLKSG